jgi:lichenan operon transcriptional antiterminator
MPEVKKFDVIPTYLHEKKSEIYENYDILLTTEQDVLLKNRDFILISPIIPEKEIDYLRENFYRRYHLIQDEKKRLMLERYLKEYQILRDQEHADTVEDIIGCSQDGTMSYHTFDNDKLYIGRISPECETGIFIYSLELPVVFDQKKIKTILYVSFHEGDKDIFPFFDAVAQILNEKQ